VATAVSPYYQTWLAGLKKSMENVKHVMLWFVKGDFNHARLDWHVKLGKPPLSEGGKHQITRNSQEEDWGNSDILIYM
jgi:hypothetical protein